MDVTPLGITTEVSFPHHLKVSSLMEVKFSERVKEVSSPQPANAFSPIEVTLLGMVTDFSDVLMKAQTPMDVTVLGMLTAVKPLHWLKALSPMVVTPSGIVMEGNDTQPAKASTPMDLTLPGIVTEVRPLQSQKALSPIEVTLYVFPLIITDFGITTLPEYSL